ncbi:MAG TPA: DEAD/DEAH box helicase family protein [Candidatus Sulfotelmatobacter sp.]|jgi:type I restriction enzyme R subunit|nr:DEAD/DEAH box helicase family protein [Candidatus Sulfotelmatobacter sp.]
MNEAETRAELIDPQLFASGWGTIEGTKVFREHRFTEGKMLARGTHGKPEIADYILVYKNQKLAVIEAKSEKISFSEGVTQAKEYATKLHITYAYATNGRDIYEINMLTGKEKPVAAFPTPDELWQSINSDHNEWKEKFASISLEGNYGKRYYQEIAVTKALDAIADEKNRILLTLATGTGKTIIAFQIAWKLFQTRWNLKRDGSRRPRILFLADRNILADQSFIKFSSFPEDALVRIKPLDIRKKGKVPKNGSIFFTIFQTFMSGEDNTPYYGAYEPDYFDFIIIDECHRGGANNEGNWRAILEYFSPAVQLGLTATPKRRDNVDTYRYFGEPIYSYSLKEGINDGFLTPFKVSRVKTTLDDYRYTSDDAVIEGEVEEGKLYEEADFNRTIEIVERERKRVKVMLDEINQNEKTLVFCANQGHAALVRDLINQLKKSKDPHYCERVTANDGLRGEQYLQDFRDNEKIIPTILTTSQKLSTGVDAHNIRNIVLMRPVNSMIEFKQIIGRGTRLFEGKEYFTVIDFVDAYKHFSDPEWDGDPIDQTDDTNYPTYATEEIGLHDSSAQDEDREPSKKRLKIKLGDGKEREIQHMIATSFWSADGKPLSSEQFKQNMFVQLSHFFKNEKELLTIWSNPKTRKTFLDKIAALGFGIAALEDLQKSIDPKDCDLLDVLAYVAFNITPTSREERVKEKQEAIFQGLEENHKEFIKFVVSKYIKNGFEDLEEDTLPTLLNLKYSTIADAEEVLGDVESIRNTFFNFQKKLYL